MSKKITPGSHSPTGQKSDGAAPVTQPATGYTRGSAAFLVKGSKCPECKHGIVHALTCSVYQAARAEKANAALSSTGLTGTECKNCGGLASHNEGCPWITSTLTKKPELRAYDIYYKDPATRETTFIAEVHSAASGEEAVHDYLASNRLSGLSEMKRSRYYAAPQREKEKVRAYYIFYKDPVTGALDQIAHDVPGTSDVDALAYYFAGHPDAPSAEEEKHYSAAITLAPPRDAEDDYVYTQEDIEKIAALHRMTVPEWIDSQIEKLTTPSIIEQIAMAAKDGKVQTRLGFGSRIERLQSVAKPEVDSEEKRAAKVYRYMMAQHPAFVARILKMEGL